MRDMCDPVALQHHARSSVPVPAAVASSHTRRAAPGVAQVCSMHDNTVYTSDKSVMTLGEQDAIHRQPSSRVTRPDKYRPLSMTHT